MRFTVESDFNSNDSMPRKNLKNMTLQEPC